LGVACPGMDPGSSIGKAVDSRGSAHAWRRGFHRRASVVASGPLSIVLAGGRDVRGLSWSVSWSLEAAFNETAACYGGRSDLGADSAMRGMEAVKGCCSGMDVGGEADRSSASANYFAIAIAICVGIGVWLVFVLRSLCLRGGVVAALQERQRRLLQEVDAEPDLQVVNIGSLASWSTQLERPQFRAIKVLENASSEGTHCSEALAFDNLGMASFHCHATD